MIDTYIDRLLYSSYTERKIHIQISVQIYKQFNR